MECGPRISLRICYLYHNPKVTLAFARNDGYLPYIFLLVITCTAEWSQAKTRLSNKQSKFELTSDKAAPLTRVSLLWHRAPSHHHHHHMTITWKSNVFTHCNTTFLLSIILHRNFDLTSLFLQQSKSGVDQSIKSLPVSGVGAAETNQVLSSFIRQEI